MTEHFAGKNEFSKSIMQNMLPKKKFPSLQLLGTYTGHKG
jgi:hypothetical protein